MATLTEAKRILVDKWRAEGVGEELLQAFEQVPREEFVPESAREHAYLDQPLHIGHEQTISQPSTVMRMLALLEPRKGHKVLEIGAGSGYACAILAKLGCEVVGVELIPELAVGASRALENVGVSAQVAIHAADASAGWEEAAPYDRVLVSAAFTRVPRHLLDQLKSRGILVAPVGTVEQRMLVLKKKAGEVVEEDHGPYIFVPIKGKFGDEALEDLPGLPFV